MTADSSDDWLAIRLRRQVGRTMDDGWELDGGRARGARRPRSFQASMRGLLRARGVRLLTGRSRRSGSTRAGGSHRRVVIKVRVAQLGNESGPKAAALHAKYLERDGVERDGTPGKLYGAEGPVERSDITEELPGERHQFRLVVSPADGHEVDLKVLVRDLMLQVQEDLGRELKWAAANHYNTDDPHAHIVIRGVDARGAEVWIDRAYISHGMRRRAEDLVTERLGPRPERSRLDQLKRDAELERCTALDRELERRAVAGVFRASERQSRDPHLEAALRTRLDVLEGLGLAAPAGYRQWRLHPDLRSRLQLMGRHAEGMRAIRSVLRARRAVVIDRTEPNVDHAELDRGVQGIVRWKGLDEAGHFVAVVETTAGAAYYMPLSARASARVAVGQIIALKRARDKDAQIAEIASKAGWNVDLSTFPEELRATFRARLEQLERMRLAKRSKADRWQVRPNFRAEVAGGKAQPYWQLLSVREEQQRLRDQVRYTGSVWLDRVAQAELASTGFGDAVRRGLAARHEYLRGLGLDPASKNLHWELQDLQRRKLESSIAQSTARVPLDAQVGFGGTAVLHTLDNGQRFFEVRNETHFVVRPVTRHNEHLVGQGVRLEVDREGKLTLAAVSEAERLRSDRYGAALRQIAAVLPMVPDQCRVVEPDRFSAADRKELEGGVPGIVRWTAEDGRGRHRAVVEAANGRIYHLPVPDHVGKSAAFQAGQVVELRPAIGMDERIGVSARSNGNIHDLGQLPERDRLWHRRRLAELERMQLAKPLDDNRWELVEGFAERARAQQRHPVAIQAVDQALSGQVPYPGPVWLDRLAFDEVGVVGFANDLRQAVQRRHEYLRSQGLEPEGDRKQLEAALLRLQRNELSSVLTRSGGAPAASLGGFEGVARLHQAANGQSFIEVRSSSGQFALVSAGREAQAVNGQRVRISLEEKGRVRVDIVKRELGRER